MTGFDDDDVDDLDTDENAEVSAEGDGEEAGEPAEGDEVEEVEAGDGEDYEDALDDDIEGFDEDVDEDLRLADEILNHKDQNARALAIRRAIEERQEAKRISRDLDYLDLDLDD